MKHFFTEKRSLTIIIGRGEPAGSKQPFLPEDSHQKYAILSLDRFVISYHGKNRVFHRKLGPTSLLRWRDVASLVIYRDKRQWTTVNFDFKKYKKNLGLYLELLLFGDFFY